jgi:hypothetical protein
MEMPGQVCDRAGGCFFPPSRLQVLVAQTWLAPGGRSRCMNREWESEGASNVSCRGSVGARPQ